MAISVNVAHVAESYDSGNIKEDVSDIIFNIDPSDTPVLSNAGRRDIQTTFEWNVESLPTTSSTNAKAEGADFASEAPVQVTRKTNVRRLVAEMRLFLGHRWLWLSTAKVPLQRWPIRWPSWKKLSSSISKRRWFRT